MIFQTPRLLIREWASDDLQSLHNLYSDPAISEQIGPELHINETKLIFEDQLSQYQNNPGFGRYVIINKVSNSFIGTFLLRILKEEKAAEIGYAFIKSDWGKGLATEVVSCSLKYIFTSTPLETIYAFTEPLNGNSRNVLDKCGFIQQDDLYEDGTYINSYKIEKVDANLRFS